MSTHPPFRTSAFLLGGIAVAILITGCSPAEPKKSEAEQQVSSEASSEAQKAVVETTAPVPTETGQMPKVLSPKETFIKMKAEFDNIKTYADLEVFVLKYGDKEQIAGMDESANVYKGMILSHQKASGIQESANASLIALSVSAESPPPLQGSVLVVLGFVNNHWALEITDFQHAF